MTIAAIAFERLEPSTRNKVAALLELNPMYERWTANVSAERQVETAFITAATWADLIKRDEAYRNDGTRGGNVVPDDPEGKADAVRNIGYADRLRHRYWHFIDLPFSPDGTRLVQPASPNAQTQIAAFRAALKSRSASADVKSYDLVWLEHLVGDVHQPLHATSRFTRDLPDGDAGGNSVMLCAKLGCREELHGFWDSVVGHGSSVTSAKAAARRIAAGRAMPPASPNENDWIKESFEAAQATVYVAPIGIGKGPFELDEPYRKRAAEFAEERVWLAGNRLADLLNDALK